MWEQLLFVFGGNATLLIVLGFLFRSVISQLLTKDVERFKTELKAQADKSIEQLKNSLQMTALEHEVRFSKLHERRAEVIEELYGRLVALQKDAQHFAIGEGYTPDKQKQDAAYLMIESAIFDLSDFIELRRIYLPEQFCASSKIFLEAIRKHTIAVWVNGSVGYDPMPHVLEERRVVFKEAYRACEQDIPALRSLLEYEFRKLLDPETPKQPTGGSPVL